MGRSQDLFIVHVDADWLVGVGVDGGPPVGPGPSRLVPATPGGAKALNASRPSFATAHEIRAVRRQVPPKPPISLYSLEDGRPYKSPKRRLSTKHGLTPEAYRAKWNLPKDYPMVAPNYAAARSALANTMGLGEGGRKPAKPRAKKNLPKRSLCATPHQTRERRSGPCLARISST